MEDTEKSVGVNPKKDLHRTKKSVSSATMAKKALKRAIAIVGSQTLLADKIGTTQGQVWYWLERAKKPVPPAEYVRAIELATNGVIKRHELRPDLWSAEDAA